MPKSYLKGNRVGAGHVHVMPCDRHTCQSDLRDGHRHAETEYRDGSNRVVPVDELTHEAYWKNINFKDPCNAEQQRSFQRCNAKCSSMLHEEQVDAEGETPCWPKSLVLARGRMRQARHKKAVSVKPRNIYIYIFLFLWNLCSRLHIVQLLRCGDIENVHLLQTW